MCASQATGSRAYERFTGMQIAKIYEEEKAVYEASERISLATRTPFLCLLRA